MQARQSSQSLYDQTNHHRKEAKDCVNNCPPSVAGANPRSKDVNIPGRFVFFVTVYGKAFEWENFRRFSVDRKSFPLESLAVYSA